MGGDGEVLPMQPCNHKVNKWDSLVTIFFFSEVDVFHSFDTETCFLTNQVNQRESQKQKKFSYFSQEKFLQITP